MQHKHCSFKGDFEKGSLASWVACVFYGHVCVFAVQCNKQGSAQQHSFVDTDAL